MTLNSAVGFATALNGREAALQATHHALNKLGMADPSLGFILAAHHYQVREIVNGASSLLGDMPLIGMSTPVGFSSGGLHNNSVVIALLNGDFHVETHWMPGYAQSGRETGNQLRQQLVGKDDVRSLICFADGFNGDADQFCTSISESGVQCVGALSSGDLHTGQSFQLTGPQSGSGALAGAILRGGIRLGIGSAHGWNPVGSQFRVTRSRGFWLRTLDGRPASETYAQLFGHPAREWAFPPLSHLARLYPLGIEQGDEMLVRAPVRVEADGSFRMNAPVNDGVDAFLLVGNRPSCEEAAQRAAQQALQQLNGSKPAFALVLVDVAWEMLLKSHPGTEISVVQEIIGQNVPIAGGYTLGQIVPQVETNIPQLLNQHILVILFSEPE